MMITKQQQYLRLIAQIVQYIRVISLHFFSSVGLTPNEPNADVFNELPPNVGVVPAAAPNVKVEGFCSPLVVLGAPKGDALPC